MLLNMCRTYSVLAVISITCLLIFSKLDYDLRKLRLDNYPVLRNDSASVAGTLPLKTSRALRLILRNESINSQRMDNNNVRGESSMESPTDSKGKVIEDQTDGTYVGQFNIKKLNDHLKKCIRAKDHEVDMDEYISIFQQLYKFFCMLGTLFSFIGSDVKSKIEILQGYREGDNKTLYETVEKMIEFEKTSDYIHSNKESSGSRTFLRLHRALIFVSKFLSQMDSIGDDDGTSRICKDAYAQTLAKFHPWLIQKGAGLAMLGLPTKKDLIAKVCANGAVDDNEVNPIMHDVIKLTAEIYDQCDKLYTEHDLHGLP